MTLDKRLTANINLIRRITQERDFDCPVCVDGPERVGKSSFLLDWILDDSPDFLRDVECGIYNRILDDTLSWTWEDWAKKLGRTKGGIVVREESLMLGRRSMSDENVALIGILTTVGKRNNRMPFGFPDYHLLEPYIRRRCRIRAYVHCRMGKDGLPTRGYVLWYVSRRFPWKSTTGETTWMYRAFTGRFTHVSKASSNHAELWARFGEREDAAKAVILEESSGVMDIRKRVATELKKRGLTVRDIAEIMGMGHARVGELVRDVVANNTST